MISVPIHHASALPRWAEMDPKARRLPKHVFLAFCGCVALLFYLFRSTSINHTINYTFARLNGTADCCETPSDTDSPEGLVRPTGKLGWSGWSTLENIFVFGDSYSDTGFDVIGTQPSEQLPMGNTPFYTKHTGPRWPVHLTEMYNDTAIRTYCFASSGASVDKTIDDNVVPPDFVEQVQDGFIKSYTKFDFNESQWRPENTLFVVFFGINDNRLLDQMPVGNTLQVQEQKLERYADMVEKLYDVGARNIMLMNVPPLERSPSGNRKLARYIASWNQQLAELAIEFKQTLRGINVMEFDTFEFFNSVLDDPTIFPETAHIKNTNSSCGAYGLEWERLVEEDAFDMECGLPLQDYFWWDVLHPTPSVQQALASQIAEFLRNGKANPPHDTTTSKARKSSG